jgi:Flavin containing amine oxidoreductase
MATEITTTVAVLGAGWAGISAGYELSQAGLQDFVVVEGGNHIGGRSRKVDFGDGYVVEDGSNWVQGIGNSKKLQANPIWELAERYGLSKIKKKKHPFKNVGEGSIQQNYESYVIYDENGLPVADKDIRWGDMETASNCVVNTGVGLNLEFWQSGNVPSPIPTQRELLEQCGWTPMSPVDDVIEWWEMDWEWGGEPDFGSGYEVVWSYQDYDEEDEFVIDQRGFQVRYLIGQLSPYFLP